MKRCNQIWLRVALCGLASVSLMSCFQTAEQRAISRAEASIKGQLKDPESATFRNVSVPEGAGVVMYVCGEVNAKNSFGGYVGYKRFYVMLTSGNSEPLSLIDGDSDDRMQGFFEDMWKDHCSKKA